MSMTNTGANIAGISNYSKILQNNNFVKSGLSGTGGANMAVSFLDMLKSSAGSLKYTTKNDIGGSKTYDKFRTDGADDGAVSIKASNTSKPEKSAYAGKIKPAVSEEISEREDEIKSKDDNNDVLKLLEIFGAVQYAAEQTDGAVSDSGETVLRQVNLSISDIRSFISHTLEENTVPEDVGEMLSGFDVKLQAAAEVNVETADTVENPELPKQAYMDLYRAAENGVLKKAIDYISERAVTNVRIGAVSENAEKLIMGETTEFIGNVEIISAVKTNVQTTESQSGLSIEDMFSLMKNTPAELRNLNFSGVTESENISKTTEAVNENAAVPVSSNVSGTTDMGSLSHTAERSAVYNGSIAGTEIETGGKVPENAPELDYGKLGIINARELVQPVRTVSESGNAAGINISDMAEEISDIIAGNVKSGADGSGFEIKMKLSPEELGDLLIKVSYSKGNVVLNVEAANKEAEASILGRIADLKESLALRGINLADVNVSGGEINYGGQYGNAQNGFNGGKSGGRERNGAFEINALNTEDTRSDKDAVTREAVMNYMRSQRLLYRTI